MSEKINPDRRFKMVLAGNPNTGKSVFFQHFTGMYVDVSNYPGTTLEVSSGKYNQYDVNDTPGVYGISSFNDEERVAKEVILEADLIVNTVSALYLERDLFLTQQLIDTGIPLVVALNMSDEARKAGLKINVELLSQMLGVPVIPTIAVQKEGFAELAACLDKACPGNFTPQIVPWLQEKLPLCNSNQAETLLYLEGDEPVTQKYALPLDNRREQIYKLRRERVDEICGQVIEETQKGSRFSVKLGRWMIRPLTGIPILLVSMFILYELLGVFIAGTVVGFTEDTIMEGYYHPFINMVLGSFLDLNSVIGQILAGEYGILTMTVIYLLGLLLPLVAGFYFILAFFEDSGYLPRIATLVDRLLTGLGLNGRGVIPIILGFGCVTMATITTRLLATEREKIIAIFLLGLTIPCSAQLGIIIGLLATMNSGFILLYILTIFVVMVLAGSFLNALLPGTSTPLLIDLPPIRFPRMSNILKKTVIKTWAFLKEAAPLFALGALLITVLDLTGALVAIQQWLAPLTQNWLGLPKEAATAFVMGLVRRDFGAAGLTDLNLNTLQTLISLVVITLFVPCIASIMMIFKERARLEGVWIWVGSIVIAFFTGGFLYQISKFFAPNLSSVPLMMALVVLIIALLGWLLAKMLLRRKQKKLGEI